MERDRVERAIHVAAAPERVWAVLTQPAHITAWFQEVTATLVELWPGGRLVLDHGRRGTLRARVVAVEPPRTFSYRWAVGWPGEEATPENSTLVEFTLTPDGDGTALLVTESGFASLRLAPQQMQSAGYESHQRGWVIQLDSLRRYAEGHR